MQNTTTTKEIPNMLIENFFMAGIPQEEIMQKFNDNMLGSHDPSVLFSMFAEQEQLQKYIQFIFPKKIAVRWLKKLQRNQDMDNIIMSKHLL